MATLTGERRRTNAKFAQLSNFYCLPGSAGRTLIGLGWNSRVIVGVA